MFSGQWNSEKLRKHWDKIAKKIDDLSSAPSTLYYKKSEINLFRQYFGNLRGKKLLKLDLWNEVNNTRILSWAAKKGAKVYGIDISSYLVQKTKENFEKEGLKGEFIVCDMRDLKLPNNHFDFIYTMGTLEHVHDYEVAVREIYRVLKPGGKAIIGVPNKLDPFLRPILVVWFMNNFLGGYLYEPEHSFTRAEFSMLLKGTGFKILEDTGIFFLPGILRMVDLLFYKYARFLTFITAIFIKPFEYLERKYSWARKNGYLIAWVVTKP